MNILWRNKIQNGLPYVVSKLDFKNIFTILPIQNFWMVEFVL